MSVITISRQKGSGGSHVGQAVASRLGWRYIDRTMLRDAAEYLAANDPGLECIETHASSLWSKLGDLLALCSLEGKARIDQSPKVNEADLYRVENRILSEIADRYETVIVGRGACHLLVERAGTLRVFVHAAEDWRVARIADEERVPFDTARTLVQESDRSRASFMHVLTGLEWCDSRQYDLAIDTSAVGIEAATAIVLSAATALPGTLKPSPAFGITGERSPGSSSTGPSR